MDVSLKLHWILRLSHKNLAVNPVDTQRRFNVCKTSYRRLVDVKTMSCVYWETVKSEFIALTQDYSIPWFTSQKIFELLLLHLYLPFTVFCASPIFLNGKVFSVLGLTDMLQIFNVTSYQCSCRKYFLQVRPRYHYLHVTPCYFQFSFFSYYL